MRSGLFAEIGAAGLCAVFLAGALGCSRQPAPVNSEQAKPPSPAAAAAVPPAPAPTSLQVAGTTTMAKTLLGEPSSDGMVKLQVAEAPAGSTFLLMTFISPAPVATKPVLEGPGGKKYPLRSFVPGEGAEMAATFEVPEKIKTFTLRHGDFIQRFQIGEGTRQ
jgi:hypothetical protein